MEAKKNVKNFKEIKIKDAFVETRNVRNFIVMMQDLTALNDDEGRFTVVSGRAGLGKTRTVRWFSSNNDQKYLYCRTDWSNSIIPLLQALLKEFNIYDAPGRQSKCFDMLAATLLKDTNRKKIIFLDEVEKLSQKHIECVRDLTEITGKNFVCIGEEEIKSFMQRARRVESRTFQVLEFHKNEAADIIRYTASISNEKVILTPDVAAKINTAASGDFRTIKKIILNLIKLLNAKQSFDVSDETLKIAFKKSFIK